MLAVHHWPSGCLEQSVSDPAERPSVRPEQQCGDGINTATVQGENVAAVVFHIDWNNGSAPRSQWTDH